MGGVIISRRRPKFYAQPDPKRPGRPRGFATPSGRVEIWSTILEELGHDPIPDYLEPPESPISTPSVYREYPLILSTGGRFRPQYHSENRHFGYGMRELHPYPIVEIHPTTARAHGISDGDWVWIETRRGKILQKARLTMGIHPNVVHAQHGWWYPELPGEEPWLFGAFISNANVLTWGDPEVLDELAGGWVNRAMLCKIYKAESPPPLLVK
jgi:anaerobic selenocysteine-containing dehydrogenase